MTGGAVKSELSAKHWKRLAHIAVLYDGAEEPVRAFVSRAYVCDSLARHDRRRRQQQQQQQAMPPHAEDAADVADVAEASADAPQCAEVSSQLAELCLSGDSGAVLDDMDSSGGECEAELRQMEELGLPTVFAVRRPSTGRQSRDAERRRQLRQQQQQQSPSHADRLDVYAGPERPSYEWILDSFAQHWHSVGQRLVWRHWLAAYAPYMTDEAWASVPPELAEARQQLLQEQQRQLPLDRWLPAAKFSWQTEWLRNEEVSFWLELLRYSAQFRVYKHAAERVAHRFGLVCSGGSDCVHNSQYWVLGGGQHASRLLLSNADSLVPACPDRRWRQRHRFFEEIDAGLEVRDADWLSAQPAAGQRHRAERLQCRLALDAFCGAGANCQRLASHCRHVVGVAPDAETRRLAGANMARCGAAQRVSVVCADYLHAAPLLASAADAVLLAPPWQQQQQQCDLHAPLLPGGASAADYLAVSLRYCDSVCLQLPPSADLGQLLRLCASLRVSIFEVEQLVLNGRICGLTLYTGRLVDVVTDDY